MKPSPLGVGGGIASSPGSPTGPLGGGGATKAPMARVTVGSVRGRAPFAPSLGVLGAAGPVGAAIRGGGGGGGGAPRAELALTWLSSKPTPAISAKDVIACMPLTAFGKLGSSGRLLVGDVLGGDGGFGIAISGGTSSGFLSSFRDAGTAGSAS